MIFFSFFDGDPDKKVKRNSTSFSNEMFEKLVFHLPYMIIFVKIVQKILNQTK